MCLKLLLRDVHLSTELGPLAFPMAAPTGNNPMSPCMGGPLAVARLRRRVLLGD